jgi:hypothetical protein
MKYVCEVMQVQVPLTARFGNDQKKYLQARDATSALL